MDEERSLHVDGLIDTTPSRVLRGTGAPMNKLPDELATVKKGTPLYGQPEWWGEEDSDLNIEKLRSNGNSMEQVSSKESEKSEASRTSVSKCASNKNTVNGDTRLDNNVPNDITKPAESGGSGKVQSPEGITNMAFTVDFGDESKPQLEGKSIRDFMPSRLRKSFRERMEKNSEKSSKSSSSSKDKTILEKSTTSKAAGRAVSEGRDISPTRQHKIDELWNTSNSSTPDSASSKRQKMMNKSSSSKSVDDESHDSFTKVTKTSSMKRRAPLSGSNSKPKSVIRARKAVSQEILASCAPNTSDNTSYLIDKMFQNNSTGSVDSLRTKGTTNSGTEYDMYHEAAKFDTDRSIKTGSQDVHSASIRTGSLDINSTSVKLEKEKHDKKVRSKEVPVTILKKSMDESSPEKEEDKVSEAGTYTIEEEKDSIEEDEARKNIDKVFGVDQISSSGSENLSDDLIKKVIKTDKQGELTLNLQNLNLELEEIERLEKLRARPQMADSMEAELGSAESREFMENSDNPNVPLDAPKWVSQWAALTNQKAQSKSDMDLSSPGSSVSDESKSSGKGQNGISRKRPGTGRKLPTIPPGAPSPASSDKSATKESPMLSGRSDLSINGTGYPTSQHRAIKGSSHSSAKYDDMDLESVTLTQRSDDPDSARDFDNYKKVGSNTSVASLDTEVLLKDTHSVMTAMEQRMGSKPKIGNHRVSSDDKDRDNHGSSFTESNYQSGKDVNESLVLDESVDFESDTSSVVALVNGDDDFVKPSLYKSPREALGKGKLKLTESLPSKPSLKLSGAKSRNVSNEKERKRSVEESKTVSDVFSDINGSTARTDDLDTSDIGQFNRQGSKGKGQMSMTRPNRAFALRRARADGDEPLDTSRSTTSISTASTGFKTPRGGSLTNLSKSNSSTPQKPRRPMSGVLADRQAPPDSQRSQASLGAQIVQKSRENLNASFNRVDGGRHSLRMARSMSIPVQPQQNTPTKSRRSEGSSTLQHSKSLRVTGVSARERSSSVSKTANRSSSPKSAERNAWKRRKEYDPRRAVAEAKSKPKPKDTKRRSDGMEVFNKTRGVTRSASFTNARDLKLSSYQCDSTSSTEEYSRRSSGASDVFDEPKRGFLPYSMRSLMSSKVSTSSADEDDMDRSARSSSAQSSQSYDTLIVSSIYQLSLKLKTQTDKTMEKLRDTEVIENGLESPLDELDNQTAVSEIPAYKSANQELAGVLKNLRKLEQHIKVINKVLFPDYDGSPDTSKEKHEYMQEIERIKNELAGFQPIETPRDDIWKQTETASVESDCEELSHGEYY